VGDRDDILVTEEQLVDDAPAEVVGSADDDSTGRGHKSGV
jgi:hypothetical protein